MTLNKSTLIILFFLVQLAASAQVKFEKEKRVKSSDVPKSATTWIDSLPFTHKIKWYKEISQDGTSYEAKTCLHKTKYSIEFTATGQLIDVELQTPFRKLNEAVKKEIEEVLTKNYDKYSIQKTQEQYIGNKDSVGKLIIDKNTRSELTKNYELIVKVKEDGDYKTYEITFDNEVKLIKKLVVDQRRSDNIEF
ncbi:hypothetical protein [Aquimarina brevivitae]|uniref:PepSY-like beta-lactamase-inhibitor n=1 Tax=Aquimarina brevivitae TaxID=323412 RepID=A0A4Q7P403_9FLAO|nr:hypothetical protein [Aquimarina brevivitae]RZS93422.1 hypothetical protein EV197_2000 [Aquimarina brevivitae]